MKPKLVTEEPGLDPQCESRYRGIWLVHDGRVVQDVLENRGQGAPMVALDRHPLYSVDRDGIATFSIAGYMAKQDSFFGGTNTVRLRRALRQASQDSDVRAGFMVIDSPGGTHAGTEQLGNDVRTFGAKKPMFAHVEDLGGSGAVWAASQAQRITATPTSQYGSIGSVIVVGDYSGQAEQLGIKVHVISSGERKGRFVPGAEVTAEDLAVLQEMVDSARDQFVKAVAKGRGMPIADVRKLADGSIFEAPEAVKNGLIDAVGTIDDAVAHIRKEIGSGDTQARGRRRRALAVAQAAAMDCGCGTPRAASEFMRRAEEAHYVFSRCST